MVSLEELELLDGLDLLDLLDGLDGLGAVAMPLHTGRGRCTRGRGRWGICWDVAGAAGRWGRDGVTAQGTGVLGSLVGSWG